MTCAILIPSLNRSHRLIETLVHIRQNTPEDYLVVFCVSDSASVSILEALGERYINDFDDPDQRYVTRMNKLVRHPDVLGSETIFFGSDDVIHRPGWLGAALRAMESADLVVVNDLHNPNGTQALMKTSYLPRAVFDSAGDAFHAGYHHNFADNEQHFTAWKRGQYVRAMGSIVEHLHPVFQGENAMPWDSTYAQAQVGWSHDEDLFRERAALIDSAIA